MAIDVQFRIPSGDQSSLWALLQAKSVSIRATRKVQVVYQWDGSPLVLHGLAIGDLVVDVDMPPGALPNGLADLREGRLAGSPFTLTIGGIVVVTNCTYRSIAPLSVDQPANGLISQKYFFQIACDPPRAAQAGSAWLTTGCVLQTVPDLSEIRASYQSQSGEAILGTVNAGSVVWSRMPATNFNISGKLYPGCRIPTGGIPIIENFISGGVETIMGSVGLGDTNASQTANYCINVNSEITFAIAEGGFDVKVSRDYMMVPRLLPGRTGG